MGNCCGKESKADNIDAHPPAHPRKTTGGTVLGGGPAAADTASPGQAAAAAAQKRASVPAGKSELARKLESQKKQTRNQTLQEVASENRARREADANAEISQWN